MCCCKNQRTLWLVLGSVAISVIAAIIVSIAVKHHEKLLEENEKDADIKECGC